MEPTTENLIQGAAGSGSEKVYVEDVYSTEVYPGDGSNNKTVTNGLDMDGEGGLVWTKSRTNGQTHILVDTVRGKTKYISSRVDAQEQTNAYFITDFLSDGYVTGCCDGAADAVNWSGQNFVSWSFRKAPGFFDIVTYTGASSNATQTISHDLACVPGMILVKNLSTAGYSWGVYHKNVDSSSPQSYRLLLNSTDAVSSDTNLFANTAPTDTGFTVGNSGLSNLDGDNFVAYLFADGADAAAQIFGDDGDESIIKCGSYTGAGAGSTVEVDLGWEPQYLLIKNITQASDWVVADIMRGMPWGDGRVLAPNAGNYENEGFGNGGVAKPIPSGFIVDSPFTATNVSGNTHIYMAIRRPMKTPEDATKVFSVDDQSSGSGGAGVSFPLPSFPLDLIISKRANTGSDWKVFDRIRGYDKGLITNSYDQESTESMLAGLDQMSGYTVGTNGGQFNNSDSITYSFKRAPGFFDIVGWSGNAASNRAITHNLGVTPELLICKRRDSNDDWYTQYTDLFGTDNMLRLDTNSDIIPNGTAFESTSAATSSAFYIGSNSSINGSGSTYVAYLFATLSGISKVGSYTGTGNDIDIDCGFTSGARFVLIKRTDADGDWYVYDTERGIIAGDDPYLFINAAQAQVTNTDYIDPLTTGFTLTSSAPDALNVSSGNYIYLAIA